MIPWTWCMRLALDRHAWEDIKDVSTFVVEAHFLEANEATWL